MKRYPLALIILGFIFVSPAFATPSWHIETIDSDGDVGYWNCLALDSLNRPHISYSYQTNGGSDPHLKYAFWDGNIWQIETLDISGDRNSIAVDSENHPHIAYNGSPLSLKYAYFDGSSWQISVVESGVSMAGTTSIAIDSQGHPHITYDDYNVMPHKLKYASFDGVNWTISIVDSLDGPQNARLCLDSNDLPHISYIAYLVADLRYAYFDGTSWQLQTVDNANLANFNSLALDTNGNPHIAYERGSSGLRYAYNLGSGWQFIDLDLGAIIQTPSIVIDSLNYEHIAYNKTGIYQLRYAHYNGITWTFEDIDPNILYPSIKTNSANLPHIAYYGGASSYHDLKYAWYGDGSLGVNLSYFQAQNKVNFNELRWSIENAEDSGIIGINLYKNKYNSKNNNIWVKLNSYLITKYIDATYIDSIVKNEYKYFYKLIAIMNSGKEIELGNISCININSDKAFYISSIFPQPAKNIINCKLHSDFLGSLKYRIYDISGKLMRTSEITMTTSNLEFSIPIKNLSNGIYIITVSSQGVHDQRRIVITK